MLPEYPTSRHPVMAQKNDTLPLLAAFLITAGLVGGGVWWLTQKANVNVGGLLGGGPSSPPVGSGGTGGVGGNAPAGSGGGTARFAEVQAVPSGLFSYGGSTTWAPLRLTVDSALQAARPEFRLRYVEPTQGPPSSGAGIQMLLQDQVAFAQSSRPVLEAEYQQAKQLGGQLKQVAVAIDGIAVAVNPSLNVPGLTLTQLTDIYKGRMTNWREVGGPDLAIVPISRPVVAGGTTEIVLKDQPLGSTVQVVNTTTEALRKLSAAPGGIYFASAPEVVPQCTVKPLPIGRSGNDFVAPYQAPLVPPEQCPAKRNQLNLAAFQSGQYPMTRNLFVVIKQGTPATEQAGEAYANLLLSAEGQGAIEKAGFVRIR
jgi:phosphate transport system substrate-binding protein